MRAPGRSSDGQSAVEVANEMAKQSLCSLRRLHRFPSLLLVGFLFEESADDDSSLFAELRADPPRFATLLLSPELYLSRLRKLLLLSTDLTVFLRRPQEIHEWIRVTLIIGFGYQVYTFLLRSSGNRYFELCQEWEWWIILSQLYEYIRKEI